VGWKQTNGQTPPSPGLSAAPPGLAKSRAWAGAGAGCGDRRMDGDRGSVGWVGRRLIHAVSVSSASSGASIKSTSTPATKTPRSFRERLASVLLSARTVSSGRLGGRLGPRGYVPAMPGAGAASVNPVIEAAARCGYGIAVNIDAPEKFGQRMQVGYQRVVQLSFFRADFLAIDHGRGRDTPMTKAMKSMGVTTPGPRPVFVDHMFGIMDCFALRQADVGDRERGCCEHLHRKDRQSDA